LDDAGKLLLPENLTIGGDFDLRGTAITALSDNLSVAAISSSAARSSKRFRKGSRWEAISTGWRQPESEQSTPCASVGVFLFLGYLPA
jgi:hypothetical protein